MPAPRRSHVLRRRRIDDEGEDEGSITGPPIDESHSEASLLSDDDGDADDSDLSETDVPDSLGPDDTATRPNGTVKSVLLKKEQITEPLAVKSEQPQQHSFAATQDTEAMMNGLHISEDATTSEALEFGVTEDGPPTEPQDALQGDSRRQKNPVDRKRQEHEEYKKKRDADPAFIPTRGQFFMHDTRSGGIGPNGLKPFGRGAGRGREVIGGPFSPANMRPQATDATSAPWAHDLHETVQEPALRPGNQQQRGPTSAPGLPSQMTQVNIPNVAPVRNFSTTKKLGHAQMRVLLPGMEEPITYANTEIKQYTKLPDHRPPLRRDKPVRISLPDKGPSYAFPAPDRSFIFIPRAMRPNQQSFGRGGRTRLGSMGGFSSRRTSVFGGSVYSPSVAMSRRSSFAREFDRGGLVSPAGSVRPIVRMPPGSQQHSANGTPVYPVAMSGHGTPVMSHQQYGYGPQRPAFRENWASNMPMHQPRPQKTVSVAGIESPGSYVYGVPPTQDHQPFQHQLPAHVNGGNGPQDGSNFYPRPQPQYPTQSTGTPLSNIPERAIHAPAFQPYQQAYFYPPSQPPFPPGAVIAPMFVQTGQQGTYIVPTMAPAAPQAVQPPPPPPSAAGQGGMVAYEQNGMVFYYDASQAPGPPTAEAPPSFINYTIPGMGGMMTPTPDGYYYPQMPNGTVYYQSQ
ncbi:Chitin synthase 4 [Venturia nashicola]|nr:Chitin synthase 4 [Venturia nashicola]